MKKSTLVGRPLDPDTLFILVGTIRSAGMGAASQGLHLNQWTLIESCTLLLVFNCQGDHPLGQAPGEVGTLAVGTGMGRPERRWPSMRRRSKKRIDQIEGSEQ